MAVTSVCVLTLYTAVADQSRLPQGTDMFCTSTQNNYIVVCTCLSGCEHDPYQRNPIKTPSLRSTITGLNSKGGGGNPLPVSPSLSGISIRDLEGT